MLCRIVPVLQRTGSGQHQADGGTAALLAFDNQLAAFAVVVTQPVAHMSQAKSGGVCAMNRSGVARVFVVEQFVKLLATNAYAVILHANDDVFTRLLDAEQQLPWPLAWLQAVYKSVLDDRLQGQRRYANIQGGRVDLKIERQAVAETGTLDQEILARVLKLIAQCHQAISEAAQRITHQIGQSVSHGLGFARALQKGQFGDQIDCVEKEVRIDLILQRLKARFLQSASQNLRLLRADGTTLTLARTLHPAYILETQQIGALACGLAPGSDWLNYCLAAHLTHASAVGFLAEHILTKGQAEVAAQVTAQSPAYGRLRQPRLADVLLALKRIGPGDFRAEGPPGAIKVQPVQLSVRQARPAHQNRRSGEPFALAIPMIAIPQAARGVVPHQVAEALERAPALLLA